MQTIEQTAHAHGGLPIETKVSSGFEFGGVFLGRKIDNGLFAEKVMEGRWMIRCTQAPLLNPTRLGEVMGGGRKFLACLVTGENVGVRSSLLGAAALLQKNKFG